MVLESFVLVGDDLKRFLLSVSFVGKCIQFIVFTEFNIN